MAGHFRCSHIRLPSFAVHRDTNQLPQGSRAPAPESLLALFLDHCLRMLAPPPPPKEHTGVVVVGQKQRRTAQATLSAQESSLVHTVCWLFYTSSLRDNYEHGASVYILPSPPPPLQARRKTKNRFVHRLNKIREDRAQIYWVRRNSNPRNFYDRVVAGCGLLQYIIVVLVPYFIRLPCFLRAQATLESRRTD